MTFWLPRRATVVVRVDQLAPECRYAGKFLVRGHRGRNVVRFRGRVRGQGLEPGTYRLIAHPRGERSRRLERVTVVVLKRPPGRPDQIRAARSRNACPTGVSPSQRALAAPATAGTGSDDSTPTGGIAGATSAASGGGLLDAEGPIRRPLGQALGTMNAAARSVIPPALFAMAVLAVLLLAVASMPQVGGTSRTGAMLVHKRGSIALAGGGALLTAIATYLLLPTV